MNSQALQRVVVRMLFDPVFADAVYRDPDSVLTEVCLEPAERGWLIEPDRRRWAADSLRRTRALHGLLEEYPVSGAYGVRMRGVPSLDPFFSSVLFHQCIQDGGFLAESFGVWLATWPEPISTFARIEHALAVIRRQAPERARTPSEDSGWETAPWVDALETAPGALDAYQTVIARLGAHPEGGVRAVVDLDWALPEFKFTVAKGEGVVIENTNGLVLGHAPIPLVDLLRSSKSRRRIDEMVELLNALGLAPDEHQQVLRSLVEDGLLIEN
jgi:hypothetical protein